jgi:hypothetical protein
MECAQMSPAAHEVELPVQRKTLHTYQIKTNSCFLPKNFLCHFVFKESEDEKRNCIVQCIG